MSKTLSFFFFNDTATTEIYTLSLHDALPISRLVAVTGDLIERLQAQPAYRSFLLDGQTVRSEEHTSELQSQSNLVCRLLLEKKKKSTYTSATQPPANIIIITYCTPRDGSDST